MKRLITLLILFLLIMVPSHQALAWLFVRDRGDSGWHTYRYTAGPEGFNGTVGFVVSNVIDSSAYSEFLLDNLSQGGTGNNDFEKGNYWGYEILQDSYAEVIGNYVMALDGNIYIPPQGEFMSHQLCLPPGADTSMFRNSHGQPGTCGSIIETGITLAPGEPFTFEWAFIAGDQAPYRDFALFYLKDTAGNIIFSDGLVEIGSGHNPGLAPLLLLSCESGEIAGDVEDSYLSSPKGRGKKVRSGEAERPFSLRQI